MNIRMDGRHPICFDYTFLDMRINSAESEADECAQLLLKETLKDQAFCEPSQQIYMDELVERLGKVKQKISKLKHARERMEFGVFGLCESCGGLIELDLILHHPEQTRCKKCISQIEELVGLTPTEMDEESSIHTKR